LSAAPPLDVTMRNGMAPPDRLSSSLIFAHPPGYLHRGSGGARRLRPTVGGARHHPRGRTRLHQVRHLQCPRRVPGGRHLEDMLIALSRERVRRARLTMELLDRSGPVMTLPVQAWRDGWYDDGPGAVASRRRSCRWTGRAPKPPPDFEPCSEGHRVRTSTSTLGEGVRV
jgi:hypothetical protein